MAKQIKHAKLNTPTARAKLGARKAPHWMPVTRGCTLGYRKSSEGGRWLAKYVGEGVRRETTIGPSDDALEADGATILSFAQAQKVARTWFAEQARKAVGLPIHDGPYKVADAMRDYLDEMERKGKKSAKDHRMRAEALILPVLGQVEISKLTTKRIRDWLHAVAQTPARLRTRPGQEQQYREVSNNPEAIRKRQSSSNRTLTILKAALNFAFREEHVESDSQPPPPRSLRGYRLSGFQPAGPPIKVAHPIVRNPREVKPQSAPGWSVPPSIRILTVFQ